MVEPLRNDENRLRVYALLAEHNSQAKVIEITGIDKGQVSRTASELVTEGFLIHINGTNKPKFYEKGLKGPELDKVIVDSKLIVYTRGVNGVKHISAKYREVNTGRVHHKKYKMQVLKEGEIKFYKIGSKYRNIQRCYAQVPYKDWFIEIELERSFKDGGRTMMYIYAPKLDLTAEQLPKEDDIARGIVTDVANYMMKNLGWRLGEVEDTNWQRHIGIDNPALLKGVAEKFYMKSTDGKSWLSNSDGRSELETSDLERAVISLDLPGEIVTLRSTVGGLVEDLKLVVEALSLAKEGMENVAAINGIELRTKAKEVMDKMGDVPEDPAFASDDGKKDKYGVMYR